MESTKFTIEIEFSLKELKKMHRHHFGGTEKITKSDIARWIESLAYSDLETISSETTEMIDSITAVTPSFILGKKNLLLNMKELSVTQYAKKKKCSRQNVLERIKRGTIKVRKVGNQYLIAIR